MNALTKQEMRAYEAAIWELAEAVAGGAEVPEFAENELAEKFGFSVAEVLADVDDTLCELDGERIRHSMEA